RVDNEQTYQRGRLYIGMQEKNIFHAEDAEDWHAMPLRLLEDDAGKGSARGEKRLPGLEHNRIHLVAILRTAATQPREHLRLNLVAHLLPPAFVRALVAGTADAVAGRIADGGASLPITVTDRPAGAVVIPRRIAAR